MTVPSATNPKGGVILRQRDWRAAFGDLLAALTHALGERHDAPRQAASSKNAAADADPHHPAARSEQPLVNRPGPEAGIE
jgi:hypothetical protein